MNYYFRRFIWLLVFVNCFNSFSQDRYSGTIYDLGNKEKINKVQIELLPGESSTYTDINGFFTIALKSDDPEENTARYSILNRILYWEFSAEVFIRLTDLSGKTLVKGTFPAAGSLILPELSYSCYILAFEYADKAIIEKIFSVGDEILFANTKDMRVSNEIQSDTLLLLSKDGYFNEQLRLDSLNPVFEFGMLQRSYDHLHYFNELRREEAFSMLEGTPPKTNIGEVTSIKVLYDFKKDIVYYSNAKKYTSHYSFAKLFLNYNFSSWEFLNTQYSNVPSKYLHLATINYHKSIDKYILEFAAVDLISCEEIEKTYNAICKTSFLDNKLYLYINNERWKQCPNVPVISSEEIYKGQNYQALNLGEAYGYLKKVEIEMLYNSKIGLHDIVFLNGIPNDLSVVAGIITTEFQSPLSHINVLSHNRNTPNMALKNGWENEKVNSLIGKLVYLKVGNDSFVIREAGIEEAQLFWASNEPQTPLVLELDTLKEGLVDLKEEDHRSVRSIGGKAANFAEMVRLGTIPLPESYFAIPFYYYQKHISSYGINHFIEQMLEDEEVKRNKEYRYAMLDSLQTMIKSAPLDRELVNLVMMKISNFKDFNAFRFRSSTNAEDLDGFNGAGIYDSYSAKFNHPTKTVENAIKKVWASLWNPRAFEERDYYKIDHRSVAMGILVHRSFPDEDANGVVITKNLFNINHGYTINVQYKEHSIVYPEPGVINDLILAYTINLEGDSYTFEYLTHSNIPELDGMTVLSHQELLELSNLCTILKRHYYQNVSMNTAQNYSDYALDIEFKLDSSIEPRKLYLKQVRIYSLGK